MGINDDSQSLILEKYNKLTDKDFVILKSRYDKDYEKYWTYGKNQPKFNRISMDEFKQRLKQSSIHFFKKYGEIETLL